MPSVVGSSASPERPTGRPPPPRLSSFSRFTRAFSRNNTHTDQPVAQASSKEPAKPQVRKAPTFRPIVPSQAIMHDQVSPQIRRPLPRSITYSNLPRPVADKRRTSAYSYTRLQSSQSAVNLLADRTPTPCPEGLRMNGTNDNLDIPASKPFHLSIYTHLHQIQNAPRQGQRMSVHRNSQYAAAAASNPEREADNRTACLSTRDLDLGLPLPQVLAGELDAGHGQTRSQCNNDVLTNEQDTTLAPPSNSIKEYQFASTDTKWTGNHRTSLGAYTRSVGLLAKPAQLSHEVKQFRLLKSIDNANAQKTPRTSLAAVNKDQQELLPVSSENKIDKLDGVPSDGDATNVLLDSSKVGVLGPASEAIIQDPPFAHDRIVKPVPPAAVYQGEPTAYWTGRFVSLHDRLLNECCDIPRPSEHNANGKMLTREEARVKHVFALLEESCKSVAARESLARFRQQCAVQKGMPQLMYPQPPTPALIRPRVSEESSTVSMRTSVDSDRIPKFGMSTWKGAGAKDRKDRKAQLLSKADSAAGAVSSEDSSGQQSRGRKRTDSSLMERWMGRARRSSGLGA